MNEFLLKPIATIYNDYTSKFAIPRQSGIAKNIKSEIIFEEEFRIPEALRGIEDFSHLWLIWGFSKVECGKWSPTVRPPKLGGNKRVGVFASRSPFRPNGMGLSSVRLEEIKKTEKNGTTLIVSGADLLCGTPIYDIKPYLPYSDIHMSATGGFTDDIDPYELHVVIPNGISYGLDEERLSNLINILKQDPRPSYHNDPERIYGFSFANMEIKFKVNGNILTIVEID